MRKYNFIVLGAGVAGLAFAKKITEAGFKALVLEKEAVVGGLARTLNHDGFRLDFCAHRFHTNNQELLEEVLSLGADFRKHVKKSRIYMFHKYLKYPFELQNLIRAMPLSDGFLAGVSFLYNRVANWFDHHEIRSYKDWFVNLYGKRLYQIMCEPYTSKIWHMDPAKISADWADQRFQGENMAKLLRRIIRKFLRFDFSKYTLEDDALAPDGGLFYYPHEGFQELPNSLVRHIQENGGTVLCSTKVTRILKKKRVVEYISNQKNHTASYDYLVSTIPLQALYSLQDRKSMGIENELRKIKYMDIVFVYLFADKKRISNDHWLYFPDKDIIFNRAVEFSNWSPKMCPEGKTSVCFDITCYENDDIWGLPDDVIAYRVMEDADRIGYFPKQFVKSWFVFRLKYAYPVYDLDYKKRLDKIVRFFEDGETFLLGRTGVFRYNNSDNSIEMGIELAHKFLERKKSKSIYKYQIKKISY